MRLHYWEDVHRKLDAIDRAQLSPKEQINYDVYRPQIEVLIENQRFRTYEMPANSDSTFWTDLGYTARRNFRKREEYTNWLGQLHDVRRYFHEQMDEMRAGAARGFTHRPSPWWVAMLHYGGDRSDTRGQLLYIPFKEMSGFTPGRKRTCARRR